MHETDAEVDAHNDRLAWRDIDGDLTAAWELLDGVLGTLEDVRGYDTTRLATETAHVVDAVASLRAISAQKKQRVTR